MPQEQKPVTFPTAIDAARHHATTTGTTRRRGGHPRTPDRHVPSDRDLLTIMLRRSGASLPEVAALVWPDLAWTGAAGCDSAHRPRTWQIPPRPGAGGNLVQTATAAQWLADRLQDLLTVGALRLGPRRRDEVDVLASMAYPPGAVAIERGREVGHAAA